ncbi:MAG: radical SAM protein [Oscillospiraceae bacterium]|nr:radical SAM protein [Oscillospiraceae bacterium]
MKKHYNIPVFITHSGCKNDCVFCNQKVITGRSESAGVKEARETIEKFIDIISNFNRIDSNSVDTEIAFFGGSFTGLKREEMLEFLQIANEYINKYNFISGIRLSTRPDYISEEIVEILLKHKVKSIELGIQSMFDEVLTACKRGHTVKDTERACAIIKSVSINLTGQMMLGLPESDREKDIETAKMLVKLGINSARIYPTIILQNTMLYKIYEQNMYAPISIDDALYRAKEIKKIFDLNNIEILRMGLCSSDDVNVNACIGPYHPAFGELVESEIIYDSLFEELTEIKNAERKFVIETAKTNMSKIVGHKRKNILRLRENFKNIEIVENNDIKEMYNIIIK